MRVPVGARTHGDPFFPNLGIFASKSSEASLFFPRGEAASTSPPRLSPDRMHSVWGLDLSSFPLSFPEGILLSTRSSILATVGASEPSGSGAGHLILSALLSHSWTRMIFRINNHDKYKTGVRYQGYLLECLGDCSLGPHHRLCPDTLLSVQRIICTSLRASGRRSA